MPPPVFGNAVAYWLWGPYPCSCQVNKRASILAEVWWLRWGREEHDEHSDASFNRNKVIRGRMKDQTPLRSCGAWVTTLSNPLSLGEMLANGKRKLEWSRRWEVMSARWGPQITKAAAARLHPSNPAVITQNPEQAGPRSCVSELKGYITENTVAVPPTL